MLDAPAAGRVVWRRAVDYEVRGLAGAVPPLGAMVGALAVAPLLQHVGRKRSLMVAAPLFCTAWGLIAFAQSSAMLIGGRVLSGFCAGLVTPSAQVYVSTRRYTGSTVCSTPAGGNSLSEPH